MPSTKAKNMKEESRVLNDLLIFPLMCICQYTDSCTTNAQQTEKNNFNDKEFIIKKTYE